MVIQGDFLDPQPAAFDIILHTPFVYIPGLSRESWIQAQGPPNLKPDVYNHFRTLRTNPPNKMYFATGIKRKVPLSLCKVIHLHAINLSWIRHAPPGWPLVIQGDALDPPPAAFDILLHTSFV